MLAGPWPETKMSLASQKPDPLRPPSFITTIWVKFLSLLSEIVAIVQPLRVFLFPDMLEVASLHPVKNLGHKRRLTHLSASGK